MAAVIIRQVTNWMQRQPTVAGVLGAFLPAWKGSARYAFFTRSGSQSGQRDSSVCCEGSTGHREHGDTCSLQRGNGVVSGRCSVVKHWEREGGV